MYSQEDVYCCIQILRVSQVHTRYILVNKATIWGSHDDDVNRRPSAQSKCTWEVDAEENGDNADTTKGRRKIT
jgi:hypothetical protein